MPKPVTLASMIQQTLAKKTDTFGPSRQHEWKEAAPDTTRIKRRMGELNTQLKKPQTKKSFADNTNEWMSKNATLNRVRGTK